MRACIEASDEFSDGVPARAPGLAATAAPAGGAKVFLQTVLPTRCLPMPVRRDVDEYWYVLHGEIDVWIGGRHAKLRAGMSAVLPRKAEQRSGNFGRGPAKVLIVATDAGSPPVVRRTERAGAVSADGAEPVAAVVTPAGVEVVLG